MENQNNTEANKLEQIKKGVESKFNKILILVEMKDGTVRQVMAEHVLKELALSFLVNDNGDIVVSSEIEPLTLKFKDK